MSISQLDESPRDEVTDKLNGDDSAIRHREIYTRIHRNMNSTALPINNLTSPLMAINDVESVKQYDIVRISLICVFFFILMLLSGYTHIIIPNLPTWASAVFVASSLSYVATTLIIIINIGKLTSNKQKETMQLRHNAIRYQRQSIQLEVAAMIARDAAYAPNMMSMLERATRLIHERFGYYHAAIFMIQDDDVVLRAASGSTDGSERMLEDDYRLRVGAEGIIGMVSASGQSRIALDVRFDYAHHINPYLPNTQAEAAIPLKIAEKVVGVLDVQSTQRGDFDDHDVRILQIMADLLATVINKTHLHETVRDYAQQLEQRVNERTQELNSERAQLKAILDNMQEGVIYHNGDDALYLNQSFSDLMQVDAVDQWHGLAEALVPTNDQTSQSFIDKMTQEFATSGHYRGELQLKRQQDGDVFDANVTCTPINAQSGNVVTVIRDISQEKALQEQKQRFLAYASHELRTPITNLKTRLYLLQKQPHRFNDHFSIINQVVMRMQWLVDDLLNHTRLEQGRIVLNRQDHTIQQLVEDVIRTQRPEATKKNITIKQVLPESPIVFSFDWERLMQVLTNMVSNAINYTDTDGNITVQVSKQPQSIRIDIQDTGIGIPESLKSQLFQPFVRGDNVMMQGTGLGLVISRQIIELHNGSLTFESVEGVGSTFTVTLVEHDSQTTSNS